MKVWMAKEPEALGQTPGRIAMQATPFQSFEFPLGSPEWELREGELDEQTWERILTGEIDNDEVDRIHRDLWSQNGDTPWVPPPSR